MAIKTVGIIGYPISHSISPAMHNAAFKHLGLDFEYVPFEVKPENLKQAVHDLRAKGVVGFNVTIPLKEAIIPILDEVTKLPRTIGAVNTVKIEGKKLVGYNTDGAGFVDSLAEDAGVPAKGKNFVLLGAGGAAKALATTLLRSGASQITITDVEEKKAATLVDYLGSLFEAKVIIAKPKSAELSKAVSIADVLINATPIGMHPKEGQSPGDERWEYKNGAIVFDLIYNPVETRFMKEARKKGARAFNGLGMLVRQGALAFTIWTEHEAPVDVMWKAAKEALGIS